MRCCGRTKSLKRCSIDKNIKWYWPFCGFHRWQPFVLIIGLGSIVIYVTDLAESLGFEKPFGQNTPVDLSVSTQDSVAFQSIFPPNDTANFNVLIIRFEDYIAHKNTECIGRSIQDHLSTIQAEEKLPLFLSTHYVADSIPPPTSVEEANNIQKRHHADLIIYGLVRNVQEGCAGADVCFRYNIAEQIVAQVAPVIDIKATKHDQDYISTSPMKLERGILQIDDLSLKYWITSLVNVKTNKADEAFLELDKITFDTTLNDNTRANRFWAIGNTYSDLGQYARAVKAYDQAITLDPKYATAYFNRGVTYLFIYWYLAILLLLGLFFGKRMKTFFRNWLKKESQA